jgi:Fur family ferric uptake transcriptional regulator
LVQRVETVQAMVRYERVCPHDEHHHHLVCDGCGLVMPFADEAPERQSNPQPACAADRLRA